jgi:hypothetical protein
MDIKEAYLLSPCLQMKRGFLVRQVKGYPKLCRLNYDYLILTPLITDIRRWNCEGKLPTHGMKENINASYSLLI